MRDARDDLCDLVDVTGLGFEFEDLVTRRLRALEDRLHLLDGESGDLDAGPRLLVCLGGEAEGLARAPRIEIDLTRDLVHAERGLVEQLLLLGYARRDLRDALRDLGAGRLESVEGRLETGGRARDFAGGRLDLGDELTQSSEHAGEAVGEIVHLVAQSGAGRPHDVELKITFAKPLGRRPERIELRAEPPRRQEADPAADAESHEEADRAAPEIDAEAPHERRDDRGRAGHDQGAEDELA